MSETRRITTGDNVSLQKVAQARETEMRDWQALNRRLNQVWIEFLFLYLFLFSFFLATPAV